MSNKSGCKISEIMLKGKCVKIGKIPDQKIAAYYKHGEKGRDKEMLSHPNFETAKRTAIVIGNMMRDQLKQKGRDSDWDAYQGMLKKIEKEFNGTWFTSGGNFCHELVDIDDNFGVVVDDMACGLYYSKKKMDMVTRFCGANWEETSQVVTHDYEGRGY